MIDCFRPSPHHNDRPSNSEIKLLVIHNIALPPNSYSGPWVDDLFMGRLDPEAHPYFKTLDGLRVSAHLFIRRTGLCIQYVAFDKRAWHAGQSIWQGETDCNNFSIGIELEGSDEEPYHDEQYHKLAEVINALCIDYPLINLHSICGHSDIAAGRKSDPGAAFDWQYLYSFIN